MNLHAFLLLAPFVSGTGDTHAPEVLTRTYDLTPATPLVHTGEVGEILLPYLYPPWLRDESGSWEVSEPRDDVVDILRQAHAREFEYEGRSIQVDENGRLVVAAPAPVQQSVERMLAFLEGVFGRSLELRIDVLDLAADLPAQPVAIPLEAVDKLIGSLGVLGRRTQVLRVSPGTIASQDLSRELDAIADYDVEIAQAALAYDPISTAFSVGSRLAMRASIAPGGVRLACIWRDGDSPRGLETDELRQGGTISAENAVREIEGPKSVQKVAVVHRSLAFSTFLPRGQALLLGSSLDVVTGQSRQLVVLRIQGAPPEPLSSLSVRDDGTRIDVLDAGYLSPPSVRIESDLLSRGGTPHDLHDLISLGGMTAVLLDPSHPWVDDQLLSEDRWTVHTFGPWCVLQPNQVDESGAKPPALTPDASLFDLAQESHLVGVSLTLRRNRASGAAGNDGSGAGNGERSSGRDAGGDSRVLARLSLPLVAGEECAAVIGGEELLVGDSDVEVAQSASVSDPRIFDAFDGLAVRLRPVRSRDGSITLDVSVLAHTLRGQLRPFESGAFGSSSLEQGSYDNLFTNERVRFSADASARKVVLGETSSTSGRGGLSLEIELR